MATKESQMQLLQDARAEGKGKGKGKAKAKAKAQGKAKAKAKGKAKAKDSEKAQAKATAKVAPKPKTKSMKRPAAAAFVSAGHLDEPVPDQEDGPKDPMPKPPVAFPENDLVPDPETLPNTFARRARPTSKTGLAKYAKIVQAYNDHILPCTSSRCQGVAQDRNMLSIWW